MSDGWQHLLYVEPGHLRGDELRTVFRVLSEHGLAPFLRDVLPAAGFTRDGDEVELACWPDVEKLLERGGGMHLFRTHGQTHDDLDGCFFSLQRAGPGRPALAPPGPAGPDARELDSVGLHFGSSLFQKPGNRERNAALTMQLFLALARATSAIYGLILSEWGADELLAHFPSQISARHLAPPGILGVASYFRADCADAIGVSRFEKAGASVRPVESGVIVELSQHPWELDPLALLAANRRWRNVMDEQA